MIRSGGPSPAEQHLGDRLAALVDGELGHDARERVLAHLATCPRCKAEADAQRQLKDAFARTAPPAPSASLLARLHNLPGGGLDDEDPDGPGGRAGAFDGAGMFGGRQEAFAFLPTAPRERGFPIHDLTRPARGRRFAFAAAGAVSLAALTLGGALPLDTTPPSTRNRADGTDTAIRPTGSSEAAGSSSGASGSTGSSGATTTAAGRGGDLSFLALPEPATGQGTSVAPSGVRVPASPSATPYYAELYAADRTSARGVLPPVIRPLLAGSPKNAVPGVSTPSVEAAPLRPGVSAAPAPTAPGDPWQLATGAVPSLAAGAGAE
ncbi:zf-HC2 domain-containing protein [Streptomyces palmae]|uniref:Putative zinc-finger domain-containing protein n=1 Tax=Streptomyces palmae TaxID=1701085 RepID=A0A4Z0HB47_9ACTN|nr:zf-HC2 domain-containing protein [Streptomyces palmae]TGB08772.1 hypothetical protein E4099_14805 [Streptomyces palmae]